MKLHLIAVGTKMPGWVEESFHEYAKRMPANCALVLTEIPSESRGKNRDLSRLLREEGRKTLQAVPKGAYLVALDPGGEMWSTETLSARLKQWLEGGRDVAFLVGGPEGLAPECMQAADLRWSLSKLTFPHPLVRVILAEALYRAWSLMTNHPYHRG